jgi:site-specific DNA-methyltransferase (adenine-specific)
MVQKNIIQDRLQDLFPVHYRNGNILMINADCMDVMAHIQDNEAELSCVDPPYGIGEDGTKNASRGKLAIAKDYKAFSGNDKEPPSIEYFNELRRISKNQIIFGANHFISRIPFDSSCWIVWDKVTGNSDFADSELAWTSFDTAVRNFRFQWSGMLQGNMKNKESRIHPTQKPVALYKWLLSRYAKQGELILDTHGGSGSIVIACHDLGHPIIWVEKDADYFRDAVARYKTHASQAVLFEPVEIMKEQKLFEV